ncbi:SDR family NAD(P)-dependent oxidoreductase [Jiangella asiatica]|uniref:SDR family oxidoreductase n=1 Tax=Jiangella asiatica TaxID=2530372 RepID=A0A4R5DH34_9ACTN|nr:SDR family oxidoreductase [Jiangella asiatica]TDE11164.1 SDR family oxidoreductase [Jiangella asiatica]
MEWRGRVGVVSGAASGIGRATAHELASRGAHVAMIDVDQAALEEAGAVIRDSGYDVTTVALDVSDRPAVGAALASVAQRHGRLDTVVNCAVNFLARGVDVTPDEWDRVLRVNVGGISNVVQEARPYLAGTEGAAVVNTASISAHIAQPRRWTYNTSKAAIVGLTRCMAMDLAPDGIRVNVVSPGWIWTAEVSKAADGDRERWEPVWGRYHLLRRLGEPEEVAKAIVFLCSSEASFITGTELMVDGGYSAMGPEGLGETSTFAGNAAQVTADGSGA